MKHSRDWWRHAVFYQVYPRSFQDSDGDGVGDLRGIVRRLPYLKSLGVDAEVVRGLRAGVARPGEVDLVQATVAHLALEFLGDRAGVAGAVEMVRGQVFSAAAVDERLAPAPPRPRLATKARV